MSLFLSRKTTRKHRSTFSGLKLFWFWRSGNRRTRRKGRTSKEESRQPTSAISLLWATVSCLGLFALFVTGGFFVRHYLLHSPRFALTSVVFSKTRHVTEARLRDLAEVKLGVNLISLDTSEVAARLKHEPWLQQVKVLKHLPAQLVIEVTEHEPVALVGLGSVYLITADGTAFRRATPSDYSSGLPFLGGVARRLYQEKPETAKALFRFALHALSLYQQSRARPQVKEVQVHETRGATLVTKDGVSIHLGDGKDTELTERLHRFDAVWVHLLRTREQARSILLDSRVHPDHIPVRLAKQSIR